MDIAAILALIAKGVSLIPVLVQAGKDIVPAIGVIKNIITGAQAGTITDQQLTDFEAMLDAMISDFNEPIPD